MRHGVFTLGILNYFFISETTEEQSCRPKLKTVEGLVELSFKNYITNHSTIPFKYYVYEYKRWSK